MIYTDRIAPLRRRLTPAMTLVAINAAVFVALRLCAVVLRFSGGGTDIGSVIDMLMLPGSWTLLAVRPWTALTYMFVQYDAVHLIVNLIWLYLFASLIEKSDIVAVKGKRVYLLYLFGGLGGAAVYLISGAATVGLVGCSASVFALMGVSLVLIPNHKLLLPLFGEASLKVVCLIAVLLVVIASGPENYGAHAAHFGGFLAGVAAAWWWRRSKVVSAPPVIVPKPSGDVGVKCTKKEPELPGMDDEALDSLLDKIRKSGYGSLTPSERERLFNISSNLQKRTQ